MILNMYLIWLILGITLYSYNNIKQIGFPKWTITVQNNYEITLYNL